MSGVDPEIAVSRPPKIICVFLDFFYLKSGFIAVKNLILQSLGIPSKIVKSYVTPDSVKDYGCCRFYSNKSVIQAL
jgi:hypothetical protein